MFLFTVETEEDVLLLNSKKILITIYVYSFIVFCGVDFGFLNELFDVRKIYFPEKNLV